MSSRSLAALALALAALPPLSTAQDTSDTTIPCQLPAVKTANLSPGFYNSARKIAEHCVHGRDEVTGIMFAVDFPDATSGDSKPQTIFDFFQPSAANWFSTASYGQMQLTFDLDTSGFHQMPASSADYGYARGMTSEVHRKYINDAVADFVNSDFGEAWLNTRTTAQPDRQRPLVDIMYIVTDQNAVNIPVSLTFGDGIYTPTDNGPLFIARRVITIGMDAYTSYDFKALIHEVGHAMCLGDMYPADTPGGADIGRYVGGFDIMGQIDGIAPDMFAWDKWRLGWLRDVNIICIPDATNTKADVSYTISGLEWNGLRGQGSQYKAIVMRIKDTLAYVLEMRTAAEPDTKLCQEGVLIYTVEPDVNSGEGPFKVVDTTPNSGGCANNDLNDAALPFTGERKYTDPTYGFVVSVGAVTTDGVNVTVSLPGPPSPA